MSPQLRAVLAQPDYREIFARAVLHADTTIRKYIWRGHPRRYSQSGQVMVGDKTAEDFVSEAVLRLVDDRRTFDPNRSLLENLNSITDSLISADKKHSDRTGIIDVIQEDEQTGNQRIRSQPHRTRSLQQISRCAKLKFVRTSAAALTL